MARVNPLVPVVADLPPGARLALYAATADGPVARGSWKGCPLNRAGEQIGATVRSRGEAACVFGTSTDAVRRFIEVWDALWGSSKRCTSLLRQALEQAGVPESSEAAPSAGVGVVLPVGHHAGGHGHAVGEVEHRRHLDDVPGVFL